MTASKAKPLQAVVLAGGRGVRLRPYTLVLPKPLLPVAGKPIIEILIRQLARAEIADVVVTTGYLGNLIQAYLQDGARLGSRIRYSAEEAPLGTAGPLSIIEGLEGDFFVVNGDTLCDVDFRAMYDEHRRSANVVTLGAFRMKHKVDLGVLETNESRHVTGYVEKPSLDYVVSMGLYVFNAAALRELEPGVPVDLPDFVLRLVARGQRIGAYFHPGRWLDMGRPDDFEQTETDDSLKAWLATLVD
jgi:NDP-mannose synthase